MDVITLVAIDEAQHKSIACGVFCDKLPNWKQFYPSYKNSRSYDFEVHDAPYFIISRPAIRLPLLRFLEIPTICPGIFSSFEVPLLEHLWLDGCIELEDVGGICAEELSSMIERSSCRIRRLTSPMMT